MAAKEGNAENICPSSGDELEPSDEEGAVHVEGIYIPPPPAPYRSMEKKGPRLIITQITNHFFKSYGAEVVVGPFHKSFNAIIGPNGSGKSNVIDSLLFVFGYRAIKLRSKKLSVLLHNSKQFSNVQSCTVSVYFKEIIDKDDEHFEEIPNSDFVLSRTALKDNSSYYTINNRKVQFKEVANLLLNHRIDLKHNRFLILQGEVEQISLMPPKGAKGESGMLEYLEDIIGTLQYREPLQKLSAKVDEYTELRIEKINRLRIVQADVEVLRKPMEEAVEFLNLENQISTKKNLIYQYNIFALRDNAKGVLENKAEIDKIFDEMNAKIGDALNKKTETERDLAEITRTNDVLEKRRDVTRDACNIANKRNLEIGEEMQQTNKDRHEFKDQLEAERKNVSKLKRQQEETQKNITECEVAIDKKQAIVDELQQEKLQQLATMKDSGKELQEKKEHLTKTLCDLRSNVAACQSSVSLAEHELQQYTRNADGQKSKLDQMQASLEEAETKIHQLTNESGKLAHLIPTQEKKLSSANEELQAVRIQEADGVTKYRSTRAKVEEFKMNMQSSRSQSRVLDALMQQKREGKCPGLIGRLGDLGAIDLKYDVAISTACGALDSIVVETVEAGEWCIDFMKTNNIGRATIIVLDKMDYLRQSCNKTINTPESVPRLFDLVRIPDDRIRPAFYFALRDTLVANDLDQASRVAYGAQRFRVVTLRGELIETTGAMSGGGGRVLRGRMGQSVRHEIDPQEMIAMERDMQEQNNDLEQLRQRQNQLENLIAQITPEVGRMKIELEKINAELQALKKRQPQIVAAIAAEESKRVKLDPATVRKLETDCNDKKALCEEAEAAANEVQQQVDAITKAITDKTQGKVIVIDKKLNEEKKHIDTLKAERSRLKANMNTSERKLEKTMKRIETLEADITKAESKMIAMKAQREEIEEDVAKMSTLLETITSRIDAKSDDLNEAKKCLKELTRAENELKSQHIEIEHKRQALQDEITQFDCKVEGFQAKMRHLKYQEIPDQTLEEFKQYTDEELNDMDVETASKQLRGLEVQKEACKANLGAIDEFRTKMKIVISRAKELDDVAAKWQQMRAHYDNLRGRRKDEFLNGFQILKSKLKEMYQMITVGGDADFELIDSYDPFSEGIQFRVRPPKKAWKTISNLSGGEKTLSSLALVFALHHYKPSPLYVMDEVDAALDFKNVSIIGNYLKQRTKNAQFLIVTLRSNMFELACHLIGIYKPYHCTKSVTFDPRLSEEENQKSVQEEHGGSEDLFPSQDSNPLAPIHVDAIQEPSQAATSEDLFPSQGNSNPQVEPQVNPSQEDMFPSQEARAAPVDSLSFDELIPDSQEMKTQGVEEDDLMDCS